MQNDTELLFKNDIALLTSSLSSSPAIVSNASILNLPIFVSTSWCEYYLTDTLSFIKVLRKTLVSCLGAFIDLRLSKNVGIYAPVDVNDQLYEQAISLLFCINKRKFFECFDFK